MSDLVKAVWVGSWGHRLSDGTLLETGVTVCEIGADEARDSANWKPLTRKQADAAEAATVEGGDDQ